jgi:uncharacterized membrane protein YhaH (DUF805 family)
MTFLESIKTCLTDKYATFSGRATRSEFWWFFLFCSLLSTSIFYGFSDSTDIFSAPPPSSSLGDFSKEQLFQEIFPTFENFVFFLLIIIPSMAVNVRRLHDTNRSGWSLLWTAIPFIGAILVLYWYAKKGTPGPNRFGEDPLQNNNESPLIEG